MDKYEQFLATTPRLTGAKEIGMHNTPDLERAWKFIFIGESYFYYVSSVRVVVSITDDLPSIF